VFLVGGQTGLHRVRPANAPQPGRHLGVVQIQVITAVAADELELAGVTAFQPALHPAGRLAAQAGGKPVAELTHGQDCIASR
jgi:hypothetical protein